MSHISREIDQALAPLTKQERIDWLVKRIESLEKDCEAFGEAPEDTLRLRILYKMRRAYEGTQTIEP
jgi:hypothetical protein